MKHLRQSVFRSIAEVGKYAALGRPYSLNGVPDMDKARCAALEVKWFQPWNRRV